MGDAEKDHQSVSIVVGGLGWLFVLWTFGECTSFATHSKALVTSCLIGRLARSWKVIGSVSLQGPYRGETPKVETCIFDISPRTRSESLVEVNDE